MDAVNVLVFEITFGFKGEILFGRKAMPGRVTRIGTESLVRIRPRLGPDRPQS